MNLKINLFFLVFFSFTTVSCGVDKTKITASSSSNNSSLTGDLTCDCITTSTPVCGVNGKNYLNSCVAECNEVVIAKEGHCVCSNELLVCGSDGQNHTECDAVSSTRYKIIKFTPCNSAEL
ncbi:MAG: Kazal-type serine protease inhibitor domain-containing protein [Bacteriovorax sp.]|nr:Kazal-type serine protease inhibitor domain-containing protein [Bacteriovorax sp.]